MYWYEAELERVIDGDTLEFEMDLGFRTRRIVTARLDGVDTAETFGVAHSSDEYSTGKEHEQYVRGWLYDADQLYVYTVGKGKYGRWLAEVKNEDGEVLNDLLVDEFDVEY